MVSICLYIYSARDQAGNISGKESADLASSDSDYIEYVLPLAAGSTAEDQCGFSVVSICLYIYSARDQAGNLCGKELADPASSDSDNFEYVLPLAAGSTAEDQCGFSVVSIC